MLMALSNNEIIRNVGNCELYRGKDSEEENDLLTAKVLIITVE